MWMMKILVLLIASVVLLGSLIVTGAAILLDDGTLIQHPEPSDELSREQLVSELDRITAHNDTNSGAREGGQGIEKYVASLLYKSREKVTTSVVNGISVAKLIDLNSFADLTECSQAALKKRARAMAEVYELSQSAKGGLTLAINVYAFKCLHNAINYCLEQAAQLVEEGINQKLWLDGLSRKKWQDHYVERNIHDGKFSSLPGYIYNAPRFSLWEKDLNIGEQIARDGTLLAHPALSDELTREELIVQISRLNRKSYLPRAEFVLEKLYKSKDKASTEVINGVSVDQLIAQNQFNSLNDCSRESLRMRSELFFKTQPTKEHPSRESSTEHTISHAINFYVTKCLFALARYCFDKRDDVISKGIDNEESWLIELGKRSDASLERVEGHSYSNGDAPPLVYLMKFPKPNDGALLAHPEPSEELRRDELVALLDDEERVYKVPEFTAEYLYKTQEKESTSLVNGVSVAKLIELNTFDGLTECSQEALKRRARIMAEAGAGRNELSEMGLKINLYIFYCLHDAVKYCLDRSDQVIEQGINEQKWLANLRRNMWDDHMIDNNIHQGWPRSNLPYYIAYAPEPIRLQERNERIEEQVNNDGTLLSHPLASEDLTRQELMDELDKLHRDPSNLPIAEFVLENLYKTREKATTEVINGVTVGELIAQNSLDSLNDCSRDALRHRSELYFRTQPKSGSRDRIDHAINFYVTKCLYYRARYCYDNRSQVVRREINEVDWMNELGRMQAGGNLLGVQEDIYLTRDLSHLPSFMNI